MCHESTFSTIRIEDHVTLQRNVHNVFNSHGILPSILETHRKKLDNLTSEILLAFSWECYSVVQDSEYSTKSIDYTLNAETHFRLEIFQTE